MIGTYEKIEDAFVNKFLNDDASLKTGEIGEKVVETYHKIENGVVGAYKKVENAFVDKFLEKDDEK